MSEVLVPGPDHPITVEPTGEHVVVRAGGVVVAESDRALTLAEAGYPPVQYVPIEDVDPGVLRPTDTSTHCPYKGDASYWTVSLDGDRGDLVDAVWGYPHPHDAVAAIAGHVAFAPGAAEVTVGAQG